MSVASPRVPFHSAVRRLAPRASAGRGVSVLQFNVLAQKLEPSPVDPTDESAVKAVQYAHRGPLNIAHIRRCDADVVVLEEVDDPATHYGPELHEMGYAVVADRKLGGAGDCTLVAYKSAVLSAASPHKVVRLGTDDAPASQFALLLHLAPVATAQSAEGAAVPEAADAVAKNDFFVVAQHAKAGRSVENEQIRLRHSRRLLLEELPAYIAACTVAPGGNVTAVDVAKHRVLWVGDFNAGPETYGGKYPCNAMPWLLNARARAAGDAEHAPVFESAMANALARDPEAPAAPAASDDAEAMPATELGCPRDLYLTTCKQRDDAVIRQTIDFVLYPRGVARTTAYLPCPVADAAELAPLYLPNADWGSDHLSVYAEVEWQV